MSQRDQVIAFMREHTGLHTTGVLATHLWISEASLSSLLNKLLKEGVVEQILDWGPKGGYGWRLSKKTLEDKLRAERRIPAKHRRPKEPPSRFDRLGVIED